MLGAAANGLEPLVVLRNERVEVSRKVLHIHTMCICPIQRWRRVPTYPVDLALVFTEGLPNVRIVQYKPNTYNEHGLGVMDVLGPMGSEVLKWCPMVADVL